MYTKAATIRFINSLKTKTEISDEMAKPIEEF